MRVLRLGVNGDDVRQWQTFLTGQGFFQGEVSGFFDPETKQATMDFQRAHEVKPFDGEAGDKTFGMAMQLGYSVARDPLNTDETGPNWPPAPDFAPVVSTAQKQQLFGAMAYVPAPTPWNREAIRITNGWDRDNIVMAKVPQLARVGASTSVAFHKAAVWQFEQLWAAWEAAGLLDLVVSWEGSYAPRFVRGSTTYLSNHAYGTAFDINAKFNALGAKPALVGRTGSVRKLVPLANEWGFYWGGHFGGRPDGMHFEVAFLINPTTVLAEDEAA